MAEVKMDLKELEAIQNETKLAKEETEQVRKELNEKISKLQDEKTELISNQKRVLFTKKIFDVKQYLPCTLGNLKKEIATAIDYTFKNNYWLHHDEILKIQDILTNFFENNCTFEKQNDTMVLRDNKEEHFEFINLDDAVQIALEQKGSIYGERLNVLEKENVNLKSKLAEFDANKKLEIENIIKEKNH